MYFKLKTIRAEEEGECLKTGRHSLTVEVSHRAGVVWAELGAQTGFMP